MIKNILQSKLIRSAGIYTAAHIFNAAVPFILMPVYTRYMTTSEYGMLAMFQVLLTFTSPFVGLSIHSSISRQFYERNSIDFPNYIGNCLLILFAGSAIMFGIFWLFEDLLKGLTYFPKIWLWSAIGVAVGQYLILTRLVLWQMQQRPIIFCAFQTSQSLTTIGLSLWFVIVLGKNWHGAVLAQLIAVNIFGVISFLILKKEGWIKWQIDKAHLVYAIAYGFPLIPHLAGAALIGMTDRVLITHLIGVSETGIYAIGAQIGMFIALLQNSFNQAWVPWFFERLKTGDSLIKQKIVKITYIYNIALLTSACALSIVAPWIINILAGDKYQGASKYVFWIALGFAFNGMYKMVTNYVFFAGKTYLLALGTLSCGFLNIGLTYWLIHTKGAIGAAQSQAIVFLLLYLVTWIMAAKIYPMKWSLWGK